MVTIWVLTHFQGRCVVTLRRKRDFGVLLCELISIYVCIVCKWSWRRCFLDRDRYCRFCLWSLHSREQNYCCKINSYLFLVHLVSLLDDPSLAIVQIMRLDFLSTLPPYFLIQHQIHDIQSTNIIIVFSKIVIKAVH